MCNEIRFRAQFAFAPLVLDTLNLGDTLLIIRQKPSSNLKYSFNDYVQVVDSIVENLEIKLLIK